MVFFCLFNCDKIDFVPIRYRILIFTDEFLLWIKIKLSINQSLTNAISCLSKCVIYKWVTRLDFVALRAGQLLSTQAITLF